MTTISLLTYVIGLLSLSIVSCPAMSSAYKMSSAHQGSTYGHLTGHHSPGHQMSQDNQVKPDYQKSPGYEIKQGYQISSQYQTKTDYQNSPEYQIKQDYQINPDYQIKADFQKSLKDYWKKNKKQSNYKNSPDYQIKPYYQLSSDYQNKREYQMSPGHQMSQENQISPGYQKSPEYQISPGHQMPSHNQMSQENQMSPGYQMSSHNQISPDYQMTSHNQIKPDYRMSHNQISPGYQMSSHNQISPGHQMSSENQIKPDYQMSPGHQMSQYNQVSPGHQMSSENQIKPDYQMSSHNQIKPDHQMSSYLSSYVPTSSGRSYARNFNLMKQDLKGERKSYGMRSGKGYDPRNEDDVLKLCNGKTCDTGVDHRSGVINCTDHTKNCADWAGRGYCTSGRFPTIPKRCTRSCNVNNCAAKQGGPPTIILMPTNKDTHSWTHSRATLVCKAKGTPPLKVEWWYGYDFKKMSGDVHSRPSPGSTDVIVTNLLSISRHHVRNNTFTCRAENSYGFVYKQVYVRKA